MKVQLEMIVANIYIVDDVYQLALKIEERLNFWASWRPTSQIVSTFSNRMTNKPLSTTNFKTSNDVNGEGNNQQASNVPNRDANKGKTSMSIKIKR